MVAASVYAKTGPAACNADNVMNQGRVENSSDCDHAWPDLCSCKKWRQSLQRAAKIGDETVIL
jgi:hypothetical protein